MPAKLLNLIKMNPMLPVLYLVYTAFAMTLVFVLLPTNFNQTDLIELLMVFIKLMIYFVVIAVASLLFFSGFGNMLSVAAAGEKATFSSFGEGLKKYILKLFLAGLLLLAIIIAFSIALSILLIPLAIAMSMGASGDPTALNSSIGIASTFITLIPTLFLLPFIVLWLPALFTENGSLKLLEALKRGAKTGTRCYGILLLWTVIVYSPTFVYMMFNFEAAASPLTPAYIAVMAVSVVLSFLYMCELFILYREKYKPEFQVPRQNV